MPDSYNENSDPLTVAFLGFGKRANEHLDALVAANSPVTVRVVCDHSDGARKRASKRLPSANTGDDLRALLEEHPCDVILICLPPEVDRRPFRETLLFAPNVKAILIEKPAGIDSHNAREAFDGLPVPVFIFHQMRLLPWAQQFRDTSEKWKDESPLVLEGNCYGKLFDQGIHILDLACWIFGRPPEKITEVVSEESPARLSEKAPLPFEWRIDKDHPGPLAIEIEAQWENGSKLRLNCGPAASAGWLDKNLKASNGENWIRLETQGTRSSAGDSGEQMSGSLSDYTAATAEVYNRLHSWLKEDQVRPDLPSLAEHLEQLEWCEKAIRFPNRKRYPRPTWLETDHPTLPILVVIPLSDHRGIAELCVRSWTQNQDCSADDFQLAIISNRETRSLGETLRPLLRPHDKLIHSDLPMAEMGQGDMEEYVIGIDSSDSEWIFLTEPHCEVPSDIVTELKKFFATSEAAGFCTGCIDKIESPWGHMEALYSEIGFDDWKEEGNWAKMIMRGFGIRRTAYKAAGGFRLRYGRFSEWLLAADLHKRGLYLDCAPAVKVIHHYTPNKPYLDEAIEEFVIGQARFVAEMPDSDRLPYFPLPQAEVPPPRELRQLFKAVAKSCQKNDIYLVAPTNQSSRRMFRLWLKREWNALRVRLLARWNPKKAFPNFCRYYETQNTLCFQKHYPAFAAKHQNTPVEVAETWSARKSQKSPLAESYEKETWNEHTFRWTKPLFGVLTSIPANNSTTLVLELPEGLIAIGANDVQCFTSWNLTPVLPSFREAEGSKGCFHLEFDLPPSTHSSPQWIAIAAKQVETDPTELRELGLPLSAIHLK